jgi:hypothetical protein
VLSLEHQLTEMQAFASYIIEATLVTIFALVRLFDNLRPYVKRFAIPNRVSSAFRGSTYDLFIAAVLLNLGLQVSILQAYFFNLVADASGNGQVYYLTLLRLVSSFVFFPVLVLAQMVYCRGRRRFILAIAVLVVWLLFVGPAAAIAVIARQFLGWRWGEGIGSLESSDGQTWYQRIFCSRVELADRGRIAVMMICALIYVFVPFFWAAWLGIAWCVQLCKRRRHGTSDGRGTFDKVCVWVDRCVGGLISVAGVIGMWSALAVIAELRWRSVEGGRRIGFSRPEDRWDFGQILAVATWLPVVIEFFYILICKCSAFQCSATSHKLT